MIKLWDRYTEESGSGDGVYRVYVRGWTKTGGWSAAIDVIAWDENEAQGLVLGYWPFIGLPEHEHMDVEATRTAWWIKVWLKKGGGYGVSWRFELRDVKEW